MGRTTHPVTFGLDPKTHDMLDTLLDEQPQWDHNRSALMRRLIVREFRSHQARKRTTAAKPASTLEGSSNE